MKNIVGMENKMCEASEVIIIQALDEIISRINEDPEGNVLLYNLRESIAKYHSGLMHGVFRSLDYHNLVSSVIRQYSSVVGIVGGKKRINTGTCFFIEICENKYAITCKHVVDHFYVTKQEDPEAVFQIGSYRFPLLELVVDCDDEMDIAVIKIPNELVDELVLNQNKLFYQPTDWPQSRPQKGDIIILAGYPAILREDQSNSCSSYFVSIAESIEAVGINKSIIVFDRAQWIKGVGVKDPKDLEDVRGFSGGPAFICRDGKLELLGVICQNGGSFFDMQISHAYNILSNGYLNKTQL